MSNKDEDLEDQFSAVPELDFGPSESVEDDTEYESLSKSQYTINSYGADYTVDSLVGRMNKGSFLVPPFQRKFVWSQAHASRFIESLLIGLPVPGIFLYKRTEDSKHLVIDGQQRLKSLQAFYNEDFRDRKFRLVGVREPWEGKSYSELDADDQLKLDDSIIHTTIFSQESPKDEIDSVHFVFERINSGGIRLSAQEIRNCIATGSFTDLTEKLNSSEDWRKIFGPESRRAKDQELIVRFFAMFVSGGDYQRPMATFLTKFANAMNDSSGEKLEDLEIIFLNTVRVFAERLGNKAFRPVRSLNAAVAEACLAGLAHRLQENSREIDFEKFDQAYAELLENPRFKEGWERSTADEDSVMKRLEEARTAFRSI